MNNATEYLNSIVSTLETLDEVYHDWWKDNVEGTIAKLRFATTPMAGVAPDPDDDHFKELAEFLENEFDTRADDLGFAYLEGALDIWVDMKWRWKHTDVDKAVALMTTGGPRCEVSFDGTGIDVRVDVWWGDDHAYRVVECAPVAYALLVTLESAEEALK